MSTVLDTDTVASYATYHMMSMADAEVILAQRLARRFAIDVRKAAGEAFLIRVGGRVDVKTSRRCPPGRYQVVRHYRGEFSGGVWLEVADPLAVKKWAAKARRNGPQLQTFTLTVENAEPVPDFGRAFAGWPAFWRDHLAGLAASGFKHGDWVRLADRVQESETGRTEYDPADRAGVSPYRFAIQFSGVYIPESDRWCGGIASDANFLGPMTMPESVRLKNLNPAE